MLPTPNNSAEALREAILQDARRQAEQMLHEARRQAESLVTFAVAHAEEARKEQLNTAQQEGARRRSLRLARLPVEVRRRRASRAEALLQTIHDTAARRLAALDHHERRKTFVSLVAEAVSEMNADAYVATCAPADADLYHHDETLFAEIANKTSPSLQLMIVGDSAVDEPGAIVADARARQLCDNRISARLQRLWPEIRLQIAIQTGLGLETEPPRGSP